ncbi:threonine/serine exporter family protein [uncultured Ilyobacter sp.]|uniref:threonine/serine exporter family protein n=1 Tax=uncultured Ilyobacter sp. TaxID=544433 RepID=UPI0029F5561A|nr:threonine/serine exporter family protein [uncultured Ilyobacter sp.]
MIKQVLFSLLATFCFAIIFNIRGKKLFFTSIGGGISWLTYLLCINAGYSISFSYFLSSIALTLFSEIFARYLETPVTTILICGLIPLVPGGGIYYTMYNIIKEKPLAAFSKGIETFLISCSLAMGIVFVTSFLKIIKDIHRKKIVTRIISR